jgi:hypothetical protein
MKKIKLEKLAIACLLGAFGLCIGLIIISFMKFSFLVEKELPKLTNFQTAGIEQIIVRKSYNENAWYIQTEIWTRSTTNIPIALEYNNIVICDFKNIENIKKIEYEKALPTLEKLNKFFGETKN